MSHYGSILVVRNGHLSGACDRGGSIWMLPTAIRHGPIALRPQAPFRQELTSAVLSGAKYSESIMIVDTDERTLIWSDVCGIHPSTVSALLRHSAPDWRTLWSPGDWYGHQAYLVQRGLAMPGHTPEVPPAIATAGPEPRQSDDQLVVVTLSLRAQEGSTGTSVWQAGSGLASVARHSPTAVVTRAETLTRRPTGISDPSDRWGEEFFGDWNYPVGGVHIDPAARTVDWWSVTDLDDGQELFAAHWSDYTVRSHSDDDTWQRKLCGLGQIKSDPLENIDEYFGHDDTLYDLVAEHLRLNGGVFEPSACILNDGTIVDPQAVETDR